MTSEGRQQCCQLKMIIFRAQSATNNTGQSLKKKGIKNNHTFRGYASKRNVVKSYLNTNNKNKIQNATTQWLIECFVQQRIISYSYEREKKNPFSSDGMKRKRGSCSFGSRVSSLAAWCLPCCRCCGFHLTWVHFTRHTFREILLVFLLGESNYDLIIFFYWL